MFTALLVLSIIMMSNYHYPLCIATGIIGCIIGGIGCLCMLAIIITWFIGVITE